MNKRNSIKPTFTESRKPRYLGTTIIACVMIVFFYYDQSHTAVPEARSPGVGYVEKIVGDLEGIRIERNGQILPPALLLPLRAGDRVTALTPVNELYAQLGNRRVVITAQNSPYEVPAIDAPPGFISRLKSTLVSVGSRLTTQYVRSSAPVSTSSRGHEGPLSMPTVEDGTSRIHSNRGSMSLAWEGGTAPFLIRVLGTGGEELARKQIADEWRTQLVLAGRHLPLGSLQIVAQDSTGDSVRKSIRVVSSDSLPPEAAPLTGSDLPVELRTVLQADSMIQVHRKIWAFEAYQEIALLADSYEPARLLRDCLESIPSCY